MHSQVPYSDALCTAFVKKHPCESSADEVKGEASTESQGAAQTRVVVFVDHGEAQFTALVARFNPGRWL